MNNPRHAHDAAIAAAKALLEPIAHNYRGEELAELHRIFVAGVKAAIEAYDRQVERRDRRLRPLDN